MSVKTFIVHFISSYETLEIPDHLQNQSEIEDYAEKQFFKIFKEKSDDFEILNIELLD